MKVDARTQFETSGWPVLCVLAIRGSLANQSETNPELATEKKSPCIKDRRLGASATDGIRSV